MRRLSSKISIENINGETIIVKGICDIQIISTWRSLTDTCKIVIPRAIKYNNRKINLGDDSLIQEGNIIKVELGYDDNNNIEFDGFIKNIGAGFPIEIECEDYAYVLKKTKVNNKVFETSSLEDIIKYCLPGIKYEVPDINYGKFIIKDNPTVAKVFDEIGRLSDIPFFFRNGVLLAGLPYWPDKAVERTFKFGFNIISDNLKYLKAEDIQLKIKAVSIMDDNTKYEASVGDETGELRTFHFYNVNDKKKLEQFAKERLNQLKYTGMQGTITTFGIPFIQQGDIAHLIDDIEETKEREGRYHIEKVVTRFGYTAGFRREIHLGRKVS